MIYFIQKKNDSDNYLAHHGVLGMHWGIRRYQNPDGTLTEEGKHRYRTNSGFKAKVDNYKKKDELSAKGVKGISNYLTRRYLEKSRITGYKLSEKDAIQKAEADAKVIKTVLGVVGGVTAAGLSVAIPAVAVGINAVNRGRAAYEQMSAKISSQISAQQAEADRWNSMTNEERFAELRSRFPKS